MVSINSELDTIAALGDEGGVQIGAPEGAPGAAAAPGDPPAPAAPGPVTAAPDDPAQFAREVAEWAQVPFVAGSIMAEAMPELAPHYTEERCLRWGTAMVPVARKHGWTVPMVMMYAALTLATKDMLVPTAKAVWKRRAGRGKPEGGDPGTVTDGAGAAASPSGATVPVTDGRPGAPTVTVTGDGVRV